MRLVLRPLQNMAARGEDGLPSILDLRGEKRLDHRHVRIICDYMCHNNKVHPSDVASLSLHSSILIIVCTPVTRSQHGRNRVERCRSGIDTASRLSAATINEPTEFFWKPTNWSRRLRINWHYDIEICIFVVSECVWLSLYRTDSRNLQRCHCCVQAKDLDHAQLQSEGA